MNIQVATKLAMEKGISIRRRENQDVYGILPTNCSVINASRI